MQLKSDEILRYSVENKKKQSLARSSLNDKCSSRQLNIGIYVSEANLRLDLDQSSMLLFICDAITPPLSYNLHGLVILNMNDHRYFIFFTFFVVCDNFCYTKTRS